VLSVFVVVSMEINRRHYFQSGLYAWSEDKKAVVSDSLLPSPSLADAKASALKQMQLSVSPHPGR